MPSSSISATSSHAGIWPYVQMARIDHWFKNAFMLLGVLLAFFESPNLWSWSTVPRLALAVLATCLIASSNYVLNELQDGPYDASHPIKKQRPVPSGQVRPSIGYAEWLVLGAIGIGIAFSVNSYFAFSGIALWAMGIAYNVPPLRTKEWPYLDVLSESVNNPLRLLLGWFALVTDRLPSISLILSYWMVGAFFMGTKRFAEYREIANPVVAAAYRKPFEYYTEERLLISLFFYATASAFFAGVFTVRYHVELILFAPVAAALFAYYFTLGLKPHSPVQNPEKLYRERRFLVYAVLSAGFFAALMFAHIPVLYEWFNIEPAAISPLWTLGRPRG